MASVLLLKSILTSWSKFRSWDGMKILRVEIRTWNDVIFMNKENNMKPVVRYILLVSVLLCLFGGVRAQSVKVNVPLWLTGSPNIGFEYTLTRQLTVNAEGAWLPYMFKKNEEVFRVLMGAAELRYYWNPQNFTRMIHGMGFISVLTPCMALLISGC